MWLYQIDFIYILLKRRLLTLLSVTVQKMRFIFCHVTRVTLRATATLLAHFAALFATPARRSPSRGRMKNQMSGDGGRDRRPWCCCYHMVLVGVFVHHAVLNVERKKKNDCVKIEILFQFATLKTKSIKTINILIFFKEMSTSPSTVMCSCPDRFLFVGN